MTKTRLAKKRFAQEQAKIKILNVATASKEELDKRFKPKAEKVKDTNGKFVVKTKLGYYDGENFVQDKAKAVIYNDYNSAKAVAKCVGKVVRL